MASAGANNEHSPVSTPSLSGYSASSEGSLGSADEGDFSGMVVDPLLPSEAVAFGSVSKMWRGRKIIEDALSLRPSFCVWADGSQMHFFAVFDGHGGHEVAALCRDQMHVILAEELAVAAAAYREAHQQEDQEAEFRAWEAALKRSFERADALGALESGGTIMGSTAVVALLVRDFILVANCGDSRAVLCRAGGAIPLSQDHKLDRPDERARIAASGDTVFYYDGQLRVRGILAMSRALGHRLLKPAVICDPEITITTRSEEDDCLILASDGLWDAVSNQVACDIAWECLEDMSNEAAQYGGSALVGPDEDEWCVDAAIVLTRLALARGSRDDISVVVVDLKMMG
ncbi:probable protein phosphatase 2C 37 [Lolium rigidum]|uniref:probable protein phosphatase 2C 37 n=1 Tax=Lolium rigidum TaxID=89674 RepID=UPI001F5C5DEE|nr:probable protein phosphatase 2C 37 [Lolium rigidum]